MHHAIQCNTAPQAIGAYSQAIRYQDLVFISGQLGLDAQNTQLSGETTAAQVEQIFKNLAEICQAAGGSLKQILKLTVYLTNFEDFDLVNQAMNRYFKPPYPARATVEVQALPKQAKVEIEAIMGLS